MTQLTHRTAGNGARARAQITSMQQALSDRLHRAGDAGARARGWTVTPTTGRLGFGGRTYRDPRFTQLHADTAGRGKS